MSNDTEKSHSPEQIIYAVYDIGGQGMRDKGLLGIFDSYEKALSSVNGDTWHPIKKIELNKLYSNGIKSL
ncbi:hypothetical protein [Microcystis phage Mae-Yong924-2]|nr:hypothetical protein [Microcystis phage Mea-Yong924-1]QYC50749.1 hypothetical protein [Microcystis phage Mae-Yong924-2]